MNFLLLFVLAVLVVAQAMTNTDAPQVVVNLDLPEEHRWDEAIDYVINTHGWENSFGKLLDYLYDIVPPTLLEALESKFSEIQKDMEKYGQEISGVYGKLVDLGFGDQLKEADVVALNCIVELTTFCTSIVAQDSEGSIYHGRNLDYSFPGLQNLTLSASFQRDGKELYKGVVFLGYVGLLTGLKQDAFAVSMDMREDADGLSLTEILEGYLRNAFSYRTSGNAIGFTIRDALDEADNYQQAVKHLAYSQLVARAYIIVSGTQPGEGAVITRERRGVDNSHDREGIWPLDTETGAWYRVETNYDHWLQPPASDNRIDPANEMMDAIGQEAVDGAQIFDVLSTPPVLAAHTVYTAIMQASSGSWHVTVRNP